MPSRPTAVFLHDTVGLISGVLKGSVRRLAAAASIQNADGTKDVTVTTDGAKERLDVSAALDKPIPAGTNNIGDVDVVSSALPAGAATEATLGTLLTEATFNAEDFATQATLAAADAKLATIDTVLDAIKDTDGIKKITDELPAGTQQIGLVAQGTKAAFADAWPVVPTDAAGNAISSQFDAGTRRLEIAGKVVVVGAAPPPATNDATIYADTPLTVGTHDTTFVIPDGETFHLQEVIAGNEDPTKGCSIEVIFDEGGTEHLVARLYRAGVTETDGYPNRTTARDGTVMIGNAGGTNTIIVRRIKYSGSDIAVDAVVRGYTVAT